MLSIGRTAPVRESRIASVQGSARTHTYTAPVSERSLRERRTFESSEISQREFDRRQLSRVKSQLRLQAAFDASEIKRHVRHKALRQAIAQLNAQREAERRQLHRDLAQLRLAYEVELRQLTRETSAVAYVAEPQPEIAYLYSAVVDQLGNIAQPLGNTDLSDVHTNAPIPPLVQAASPIQLSNEAIALLQRREAKGERNA